MELGGPPVDSRQSLAGGHPYLPPGSAWPQSRAGAPMIFVIQVNFADVPALPGFPSAGLMQWFVAPDDGFGQAFDDDAGLGDFQVRWWDGSTGAASVPFDAPVPPVVDDYSPVALTEPHALRFRLAPSLPEWDGLPPVAQQDPIWGELGRVNGEDAEDAALSYHEFAWIPCYQRRVRSVGQVGGFASFVQWDPRTAPGEKRYGQFSAVGEPSWPLLIELDSAGAWEWGDVGVAHLFGDPSAVGRGDLSSVRYHWDCH